MNAQVLETFITILNHGSIKKWMIEHTQYLLEKDWVRRSSDHRNNQWLVTVHGQLKIEAILNLL
jgi:hypothetical protein